MSARFPRKTSLTLVGAVAFVLSIANPAAAPPGDLDPTFDGDGKVTTDFAGSTDQANALAIQANGKLVTAGFAFAGGTFDFALARHNSDGSLDTTFSGDGKVTTDFAGSTDQANALAIQPDGKIVAAGRADVAGVSHLALARYNTDGSPDITFSGDGNLTTDIRTGSDLAQGVTIQADGKIVAAGWGVDLGNNINTADFTVVRYNADGSLDTTFDGDGIVTTDFVGADQAFAVAIQGDGKIVAAGLAVVGNISFALARYNADGSLDSSFDGDGKVTTDFAGGNDEALGVAIQGDGKIVAAGIAGLPADVPGDFALARYNVDGSLDPTFSGDGKVTTDFAGGNDGANAVAIQPDRKIVAAGFADVPGQDFALARYTVSMCRRIARASMPICL